MESIVKSLILISRQLLASGSVTINPRVKARIDKLVKEHLDDKVDEIQTQEDNRSRGFNLSKWQSKFSESIKEAKKDLQPELEKESNLFIHSIEKALKDNNIDELKDIGDLLWKRWGWYVKNEKYDHVNKDNETKFYSYRKVIQELNTLIEAFTVTREEMEEGIKEAKKMFQKQENEIFDIINKFIKHLEPIAKEINRNLVVNSDIEKDDLFAEKINLNFSIDFAGSDLGVTVFPSEDGKVEVDDIVEDSDFFQNVGDREAYEGLIHYLRTGQLPKDKPVKFIKLYRAMSSFEYRKWQNGETIPENKYFTNKNTGDFAADFQDENSSLPDYSHGVEVFRGRSDCISEYSSGIFMTNKKCVMVHPNYIVPKE